MVRIGVSIEGPTEERFVKGVLAPYLANKSICMTPINIGGNVNVDRIRDELKRISYGFDWVTTLYDFYGFKGKDPHETKSTLEEKISDVVHESIRSKLIPYVQMYEFEGLLFSCPETLSSGLMGGSIKDWAQKILSEFDGNPELINDSQETAPSKRLLQYTNYRKTTHGPNIAKVIGIEKIREKCSGFNEWLIKIEGLVA